MVVVKEVGGVEVELMLMMEEDSKDSSFQSSQVSWVESLEELMEDVSSWEGGMEDKVEDPEPRVTATIL